MPKVVLGFVDKCEPWKVQSRLFPSKVGGKPAWLSLKQVPSSDQLTCETCNKVMMFLCQIYAPIESGPQLIRNFHRTIFVFLCRTVTCNKNQQITSFKIFRSTLPRENEFYSANPPELVDDPTFDVAKWINMCNLCGIAADKKCGRCKRAMYCSKEHQTLDWKKGHKLNCSTDSTTNSESTFLFPERELVNEEEVLDEKCMSEEQAVAEFHKLKDDGKIGTLAHLPESELESHVFKNDDETFSEFTDRISEYPDQVIRYDRGGAPLLIADSPLPSNIPNCEYCGQTRQFEFQIMPQLLYELHELVLDWGILLIFTCKDSCIGDSINSYKKEFVFRQDVTNVDIKSNQATDEKKTFN
ncbi:hypothetical protein HUJ04_011055 [Dendroctonus ponderosae]|nr:hypothetical protein HUJ04_011055 [Dendroctonus ponderosae]